MSQEMETKAGGSPIATDLEMVDQTQPEAAGALDLSLGDVEKSDKDAPIEAAEKVIENAAKTDDGATAEGALKASPEKTPDEASAEGALKMSPDQEVAAVKEDFQGGPKADLKIDAEVVGETSPEKALESEAAALVKGSVVTAPEILQENVKTVINGEKAEDEIPKVVEKTDDLPKDEPVTLLQAKLPMAEAADVPGDKGMKSSEAAKAGNANDSIEKADGKIVESKNQEEVVSMDIDIELTERARKPTLEQNKENENANGGNVKSKEQEKYDSKERDTERARKHKSGHKRERSSSRASDRHHDKRSRASDRHDKDGDRHSSSGSKRHHSTHSSRSKK